MKIPIVDKIYILHHRGFKKRLAILTRRLSEEGITDYEIVDRYPPEMVDYAKHIDGWDKFVDIDIVHPYGVYRNFSQKISRGSLSLVLKHLHCYIDQVKNNYSNILILEDDCLIPAGFLNYVTENMIGFNDLLNTEGTSMLMMGTSHHYVSKKQNGKCVQYDVNQKCRCTHAYAVNISVTNTLLDNFHPINLPIDFKLNEIMQLKDIKVAWSEPGIKQRGGVR